MKNGTLKTGNKQNNIRVFILLLMAICLPIHGQINTEKVMIIARNALYFEDYALSIQYFNEVIRVKPYQAEPFFYRSVAKLYLNDMQGAEQDATQCIERNPFITNAYQVRGIARQNMKKYNESISDYQKGLQYDPENKIFLQNLAVAYIQTKQYDLAAKGLDKFLEINPKNANAYFIKGVFELERGDTLAAFNALKYSLKIDKFYARSLGVKAMIEYLYNKQETKALDDLAEAIRLDNKQIEYYINRALIYYKRHDLKEALQDYDTAIEIEPKNETALFNRGLLLSQIGDRNNAVKNFSILLEVAPDNTHARYNRALLYSQLGELTKAITDYSIVLEQYPYFIAGYFARSEARRKLNQITLAKKDYDYALALQKEAEAGVKKSTDNFKAKDINLYDQVVASASNYDNEPQYENTFRGRVQDRKVDVSLSPMFTLTYYSSAKTLIKILFHDLELEKLNKTGKFSAVFVLNNEDIPLINNQIEEHFNSINHYSKIIADNHRDMEALFGRAIDFILIQDLDAAMNDLDRLIEMSPEYRFAYLIRANARYKRIQSEDKGEQFSLNEATLGKNSRSFLPEQVASTAISDNKKAEYGLVVRDLDQFIKLHPYAAYGYYNRACVLATQKNYREALLDYNQAIAINPNFAHAYFNRGLIYMHLSKREEAINDLSKAGELGIIESYNIIQRLNK